MFCLNPLCMFEDEITWAKTNSGINTHFIFNWNLFQIETSCFIFISWKE